MCCSSQLVASGGLEVGSWLLDVGSGTGEAGKSCRRENETNRNRGPAWRRSSSSSINTLAMPRQRFNYVFVLDIETTAADRGGATAARFVSVFKRPVLSDVFP